MFNSIRPVINNIIAQNAKFKIIKNILPELTLLISLFICTHNLDLNWFNTHMSRDIFRVQHWNWLGPEIGWDYKRLPGPFYYWLLGLLTLSKSIYFILLSKILALYTVLYFLTKEIQKSQPHEVLNNFLSLFLLMPVFIFSSRNIWNPSWIILFNCLQFIFLLRLDSAPSKKWIYISTITAICGMQVHFSTLMAYLASGLSVMLLKEHDKSIRRLQAKSFLTILSWLLIWFFIDYVPQFSTQIDSFYGLSSFFLNRISDLTYHLTLNLSEIPDYDLFSIYFRSLSELNLINGRLMLAITKILGITYFILFIFSYFTIARSFFKKRKLLDLFLVVHTFLFLISIFFLKNKSNIPYRYGLALYPVQFFIISYGLYLSFNAKKIMKIFSVLIFLTFVFYFYFNFKVLEAQDRLGRAHHTNNDNLELTLRNKTFIYNFLKKNVNLTGDPFNYLHGRTANKFRLKEMNWEQSVPYFSLYNLVLDKKFNYEETLKNSVNNENWLVQLKNLEQLREEPSGALKLTELNSECFPQNLKLLYLDSDKKLIQRVDWNNSSLILPSAFIIDLNKVSFIRVQFELNTTTYKYINLLIDDNDSYSFAYQKNYEILRVTANRSVLQPIKNYHGFFLVQNQYIFDSPQKKNLSIEIDLELKIKYNNFSRLDIFTTADILPEEELFPAFRPK